MGKGGSEWARKETGMSEDAPMNIGALVVHPFVAEHRVLRIQTKLHRWAAAEADRRFDDLFNLVADPAFLVVAWNRVRRNKGARTAGIDAATAASIESRQHGVAGFLTELRSQVKDRSFEPVPVRTVSIPKANGKTRRLGIPTVTDRVVQASLKLVLEPILEADFDPSSYGFRPGPPLPRRHRGDPVPSRPRLRAGLRGRHRRLLRRDRPHGPAGPVASTRSGTRRCWPW